MLQKGKLGDVSGSGRGTEGLKIVGTKTPARRSDNYHDDATFNNAKTILLLLHPVPVSDQQVAPSPTRRECAKTIRW